LLLALGLLLFLTLFRKYDAHNILYSAVKVLLFLGWSFCLEVDAYICAPFLNHKNGVVPKDRISASSTLWGVWCVWGLLERRHSVFGGGS
jgi:hypothetical protein